MKKLPYFLLLFICLLLNPNFGWTQKPELRVQMGHQGGVTQITPLPDGKTVLSAGNDNVIIHWDIKSGREIKRFQGHTGHISQMILLPDKKTFLTRSWDDKTVKQWDLASGKEIRTFAGHTRGIGEMILLPDKKTFLTRSWDDKTVKQWDLASGKEIRTFAGHTGGISGMILLPDKKTFLTRGIDDKTVKQWDLASGKEIRTFAGHTGGISGMILLLDKKTFLTWGSDDKTVKHWHLASGKQLHTFQGLTNDIDEIFLLSDGKSFLTKSANDKTIEHWDIQSGKQLHTFQGHAGGIGEMILLPDKKTFLTTSDDGTVRHWSLENGKEIKTIASTRDDSYMYEISLLPDKKSFFTHTRMLSGDIRDIEAADYSVKHWDIATGKLLQTFKAGESTIFLSNSLKSQGNMIEYQNLMIREKLNSNSGNTENISEIVLHPDGKTFLTACGENLVKYWNLETPQKIRLFKERDLYFPINKIILLPDAKSFLTLSSRPEPSISLDFVTHWDLETGRNKNSFGSNDWQQENIILPDSKSCLMVYFRDIIHWDLVKGKEIDTFKTSQRVGQIVFLHKTNTFLTVGSNVKHWDLSTSKEICTYTKSSTGISKILLLPNEGSFLSNNSDGTISHWDITTGREIANFSGSFPIILLPDNQSFLTSNKNGVIKHWNLLSGEEISTFDDNFEHQASIEQLILLADEKTFLGIYTYEKKFRSSDKNEIIIYHWDLVSKKILNIFLGYSYGLYNQKDIGLLPTKKTLFTKSIDDRVIQYDIISGRVIHIYQGRYGGIKSFYLLKDNVHMFTINEQNSITLWDIEKHQEIVTLIPLAGDNQNYVLVTPDDRFDGTPEGMKKLLHFVVGNEVVELEQLKDRYYEPGFWKKR